MWCGVRPRASTSVSRASTSVTPGVPRVCHARTMTTPCERAHPHPVVDVLLREIADTGALGPQTRCAVIDLGDAAVTSAIRALEPTQLRTFSDSGFLSPVAESVDQPEVATGAELVVGLLPKSLAELDEIAAVVASSADERVTLMLAGREKHLVRSMNDVLSRHFEDVRASRGARKSRVLVARRPRADVTVKYPACRRDAELELDVCAHGAVFAGNELDIGTRALLETLGALPGGLLRDARVPADITRAVDLGCGSGILAAILARSYPDAEVIATDRSWAACASAVASASANRLTNVHVLRADAGAGITDGSVDLVLCNPPFHDQREVDAGMANTMFASAGRMLRSGGVCLTVFNSHLRHRTFLERCVGPTQQLARTSKFTVTRSVVR